METDEIREIVQLMDKHGLSEFNIKSQALLLDIKRDPLSLHNTIPFGSYGNCLSVQNFPPYVGNQKELNDSSNDGSEEERIIKSQLVGVFYRGEELGSIPYIRLGDSINETTVVGMIKAMEIPNEVIAAELGIVQEFLVEDGQTVEYGTPLMIVRKG